MLADYPSCFSRLIQHEGSQYTDDPRDPGGPTKFGVTIADARLYGAKYHWVANPTANDVRNMPFWFAQDVYKPEYWDKLQCDKLPAGVDDSVFDYGVNSGIGRSGRVLRRVVGLNDNTWIVDQSVLDAVAKRDPIAIIAAFNAERLQFLRGLGTFDHFGKGWTTRVKEVKAYSVVLAQAAKNHPVTDAVAQAAAVTMAKATFTSPTPQTPMAKGAVPKPDIPAGTALGVIGTGLGTGLMLNGGVTLPHIAMAAGAAAVAIGGVALFTHLNHQNTVQARQEGPSGPVNVVPAFA